MCLNVPVMMGVVRHTYISIGTACRASMHHWQLPSLKRNMDLRFQKSKHGTNKKDRKKNIQCHTFWTTWTRVVQLYGRRRVEGNRTCRFLHHMSRQLEPDRAPPHNLPRAAVLFPLKHYNRELLMVCDSYITWWILKGRWDKGSERKFRLTASFNFAWEPVAAIGQFSKYVQYICS